MNDKKFFNDERLARIFRWWAASAVYFFIGWGTGVGAQSTVIDFVFFLGIAIGLFEMFVVNPVINSMFKVKNPLQFTDKSVMKKVIYRLRYFARTFIILIFVVITYDIINYLAIIIRGLDSEAVFLPGEPIMFGIFYIMYYLLIDGLGQSIKRRMKENIN